MKAAQQKHANELKALEKELEVCRCVGIDPGHEID